MVSGAARSSLLVPIVNPVLLHFSFSFSVNFVSPRDNVTVHCMKDKCCVSTT
jgi:hypothetical protein